MPHEDYTFEAQAQSGKVKGPWRITLGEDIILFEPADGSGPIAMDRETTAVAVELGQLPIGPPYFAVRMPKRVLFSVKAQDFARLKAWLGPPSMAALKAAFKRRLAWAIPIGILFILTSFPLPGDPETGTPPVPFDTVAAFLGSVLVILGLFMWIWPRRELFLVDSAWFVVLAVKIFWDILEGANIIWVVLVFLVLLAAMDGLRLNAHFQDVHARQRS